MSSCKTRKGIAHVPQLMDSLININLPVDEYLRSPVPAECRGDPHKRDYVERSARTHILVYRVPNMVVPDLQGQGIGA